MKMVKENTFKQACENMISAKAYLGWNPSKSGIDSGTGGDNVLIGYINTRGSKAHNTYPCHNPIQYYKDAEVLWSCFGYKTSEIVAKTYLNWLIKDSPWSNLIDVSSLDQDFIFTNGFVFKDLDKIPANLLHNFLIGSRMASEWPKFIDKWYELVTLHKLNPTLSFIFLTCFDIVKQDGINSLCCFSDKTISIPTTLNKYDWPIDIATANETYIKNFLAGKTPGLSSIMFYPTAVTRPINILWGQQTDLLSADLYSKLLNKLYAKDFTIEYKPKEVSSLSLRQTNPIERVFTPESLVEVLKLEEKRLCCP